jgi:DNA-binding CsgD family transcriptional regulator/sugar lactone lactonase YvrE
MRTHEGYRRFKGAWQPSAAERRVLDELVAGRTNAEIAVRLGLSVETVKSHVSRVLGETGCADRAALARWWRDQQARQGRPPLLVPLLGWAGRAAALLAGVALGALLLMAGVRGAPRVLTALDQRPRSVAVAVPDPPPMSTPATGFVRRPLDVLWTSAPPPLPLVRPVELALDSRGVLYVVEARQHLVFTFDAATGAFLGLLGGYGHADGRFDFGPAPELEGGIAVDGADHVYVYDATGRIQKFAPDGAFVLSWSVPGHAPVSESFAATLATDGHANIYASDSRRGFVWKFDGSGSLLATWPIVASGLAFDQAGTLYATDGTVHRVRSYDAQGQLLAEWGQRGVRDGEFEVPEGIAVDAQGMVYVVDNLSSRLVQFDDQGRFVTTGGGIGAGPGDFARPGPVLVDAQGNLYVGDLLNQRVQKVRLR